MGVLSPAGAARERVNTCATCGTATWAHDRKCDPCRDATTCKVDGCEKPARSGPMCSMHEARLRRTGTTDIRPFHGRVHPNVRFWTKVDLNGPVPEYAPHLGPCWIWNGTVLSNGYGQFTAGDKGRRRHLPHRYAYEILVGTISAGLHLDHLCRVTRCVNPAHLEPVTPAENNRRSSSASALNAAKETCKRGHELVLVGRIKNGHRGCPTCQRMSQKALKMALLFGYLDIAHGLTAYSRFDCRCEVCTTARREFDKEALRKRNASRSGQRRRDIPCQGGCGYMTRSWSAWCGFCRPDAHEAAELRDEAMTERYS